MKSLLLIYKTILLAIMASTSLQAQWTQSALPVSNQSTDLLSYGGIWYVATSDNGIQRSQNFTDWYPSFTGIGTSDIRRIISSVEGANIVFYASTANGVYRSTMMGYSWTAVNNGLTSLNAGAIFSDGNILLANTEDGVFRSEDYGQNWSAVNVGASNQLVRCFLKNGPDLLAGLANTGNYLYRSTDDGLTWSPYGTGLYEVNLLAKLDDELFAASATLMYHSTDNGLTWSPAGSGLVPGMYITDMTAHGDYLYVATHAGGYVQHRDSSSFRLITSGMPQGGYMINTVGADNDNIVFGTLSNGLWYAGSGVVTGLNMPAQKPGRLFPDPASTVVTLNISSSSRGEFKVSVRNFCGQTVLSCGIFNSGTDGLTFDVSNLPPGAYFILVEGGGWRETHKLLICR